MLHERLRVCPAARLKHGDVLHEVAPAAIAFPLPEQKGQVLQLRVALICDLRPILDMQKRRVA